MLSRSKYLEDGSGKAWQRLIREEKEREHEGRVHWWEGADLSLKCARVRPITRAQAEKMILEYEWLGCMATTSLHFGLFFDNVLGGVTCIGSNDGETGGRGTADMFGIARDRCLILARGACPHWAPTGAASKLIAWTARLLQAGDVGDVLLAYGDPEAGEIGTVYQACGWHYLGRGSDNVGMISREGRRLHNRSIRDRAVSSGIAHSAMYAAMRRAGWRDAKEEGKHRYCTILAQGATRRRIEAKIAPLIRPYPKREKSVRPIEGPRLPVAAGGASPTRTLHIEAK